MPAHILNETKVALGGDTLPQLESRSLMLDRYAEPDSKDEKEHTPRKAWFNRLCDPKKKASASKGQSWLPSNNVSLYGSLRSRLMLNMSGGVMENANICLDRYGMPYIPGSAVKGCARRAALAALKEWSENGQKPTGDDKDFNSCEEMLKAIAQVFGWGDMDWKKGSDFVWAMEESVGILPPNSPTNGSGTQPLLSNDFAGSVAFLPAYPNKDPGLELDVLTCHHGDYYSSENPNAVALDTENPVPVYFPAVKSQEGTENYFSFALLPLRGADEKLVGYARTWLKCGLETFGIGAKTAAGYGWFDCSPAVTEAIEKKQKAEQDRKEKESLQKAEQEKQAAEALRKKAEKEALAQLSPEQQEDKKVELLTEPQFKNKVHAFHKESKKGGPSSDAEKQAIVRALRGSRLDFWQDFKTKATKGDQATASNEIRSLSKKMFGDKEGKMP